MRSAAMARARPLWVALAIVVFASGNYNDNSSDIFALAVPYTYLSYANITAQLHALARNHPDIVHVYSAQDKFNLPSVGQCDTISNIITINATVTKGPCLVWVVELTERASLVGDITRPEMLVSGSVHGDEVVGPQACMGYINYMVASYVRGDPLAKRLLATRIITLIPTANAIGYEIGVREEIHPAGDNDTALHGFHRGHHSDNEQAHHHAESHIHYDPNRDFAFDNHPSHCMRTVAARVINELMLERMFQILITFHGGTNVIGYEWGDTKHCKGKLCAPAPDVDIMKRLAYRMRQEAGSAGKFEPEYRVGTMGALVYPVNGGMEDWAYGASWSGEGVVCTPTNLGGYPKEKTTYTPAMTRAITYLVETGLTKRPAESTLGGDSNPMKKGGADDGHVPRNIRLLATVVDALEAYIVIDEREKVAFSRSTDKAVAITWRIKGAFVVDGTYLQWGTKGGLDGVTKVIRNKATGNSHNATTFTMNVPFNTDKVPHTEHLYVRAAAVVDNSLDVKINGAAPNMLPQSHLLAARARSGWKHRIGDRVVISQRVIYSQTVRITAAESYVTVALYGNDENNRNNSSIKWGVGSGRIPAPGASSTLHTLYPAAKGFYTLGHNVIWPWMDFKHPKSVAYLALLIVLWAVPVAICCARYCGKDRASADTDVEEPLVEDEEENILAVR